MGKLKTQVANPSLPLHWAFQGIYWAILGAKWK